MPEISYICTVKDLSRHIEYLLWERDCVVIPDFGTFMVRMENARYIQEEDLYLPPYRSVHYVPEMKEDDGVLASCLTNLHHVNTSVAKKWISDFVESINMSLLTDGEFDLGTIGTLSRTDNGIIAFDSCEAGVNSPTLYGLDAFQFKRIPLALRNAQINDQKNITIRISRRAMRIVSSIAAILILVAMVIVPTRGMMENPRFANVFSFQQLWQEIDSSIHAQEIVTEEVEPVKKTAHKPVVAPKSVTTEQAKPEIQEQIKESEPIQETEIVAEPKQTVNATPQEAVATPAPAPQTKYVIVLASAITETNADIYVEKLQKRGFENIQKLVKGNMVRVVMTGFSETEMAHEKARSLREQDDEFKAVWVLTIE